MNKYKKALNYIKEIVIDEHADGYYQPRTVEHYYYEVIDDLNELVEKATPKKPTKTTIDEPVLGECVYETYDAYKCPICGKMIAVDYYGLDYRDYCQFCGQAIDWSEDDG